jgi:hypothetical protein
VALVADVDGGAVAGWIATVFGATAVLVTAIVTAYKAWVRVRGERDTTTIGQYRELTDRLQRQIERQDAHAIELSDAIEQMTEEHAACQIDLADLYGEMARLHDFARRVAECCRKLGEDPGEPPPMPARPARQERGAEFRKRTLAQTTANLHVLSGATPPPQPSPGAQP